MENDWRQSFRDKLSGYKATGEQLPWEGMEYALKTAARRKRIALGAWIAGGCIAAAAVAAMFLPQDFSVRKGFPEEHGNYMAEGVVVNKGNVAVETGGNIGKAEGMRTIGEKAGNIETEGGSHLRGREKAGTAKGKSPEGGGAFEAFQAGKDEGWNGGNRQEQQRGTTVESGRQVGKTVDSGNKAEQERQVGKTVEGDSDKQGGSRGKTAESGNKVGLETGGERLNRNNEREYQTRDKIDKVKKRKNGKLTAYVYGSGTMSSPAEQGFNGTVFTAAGTYGSGISVRGGAGPIMNSSTHTTVSERYEQPIRFGLSLKYGFSDRIGIASGVTYSHLRSSRTDSYGELTNSTLQSLHYIGIPMQINYTLFRAGNLGVYLTAGGSAEKMIYGKRIITESSETRTETIHIRQLQFSAGAGAGLDYRISGRFGIYAEPRVSWHFPNGSPVETFYSHRPIAFNLNIGLRLDL